MGCGGEGPSPLSLALRDTPSRIASGSLRGAGTGPPSGSLCCRGGPPLGARNAARNFILKCALMTLDVEVFIGVDLKKRPVSVNDHGSADGQQRGRTNCFLFTNPV